MPDNWLTERLRRLRGFITGEDRIRRAWLDAARAWVQSVIRAVLAPTDAGMPPDPAMVLSQNGRWVEELTERVRPTILDMLRTGWRQVRGADAPDDEWQSFATGYLDVAVNRMVRTPEQVYRLVAAAVADGTNAGESIPDIAARVQHVLDVTGNEDWPRRATVVARTESVGAVNAASMAAAAESSRTEGRPYDKEWLATVDDRTRPSHRAADGQRVPLTAPFDVGASQLQFPGDPTGPAEEVIQCRCTLLFMPSSEQSTPRDDRQMPREP